MATISQSNMYPGHYSIPFTRDYKALESKVTPEKCNILQTQGYIVFDDFFPRGWANALYEEMQWLQKEQLFKPNKTQFTSTTAQVFQFNKPNIYEIDLHDHTIRMRVPELEHLFHSNEILQLFQIHLPELDLKAGNSGRTLKLQWNAGNGGCFPCHYDNPGAPNKRQLTCLLYLNEHWKEGDGGEVQLLPFLQKPITIAPKMNRVVVFMSDWILHRVLPNYAERFCLTIWLDGGHVNAPEHSQLRLTASDLENWGDFIKKLQKSPVQRLLSRGVYEEEYAESLSQCMGNAPEGYIEMLKAHETHVNKLKNNAPLYNLILRLRLAKE